MNTSAPSTLLINLDLYCQHSSWPPQQGKPERSWTWLQRLLHVLQMFAISLEWFLDVLAFFAISLEWFSTCLHFFFKYVFLWRSLSLVYFRYTRCYDAFTSVCCSWQNKRSPIQKIQVSFVMNEFLAKCGIHQWDLLVLFSKGCSTQIQVKNEAWKTTAASSLDLHGSNWLDDMAW